MGPFDREVNNSFDKMFDRDRDGFLNASEEALKYEFLSSFDSSSDLDDDFDDDVDFDDFDDTDEFD